MPMAHGFFAIRGERLKIGKNRTTTEIGLNQGIEAIGGEKIPQKWFLAFIKPRDFKYKISKSGGKLSKNGQF